MCIAVCCIIYHEYNCKHVNNSCDLSYKGIGCNVSTWQSCVVGTY